MSDMFESAVSFLRENGITSVEISGTEGSSTFYQGDLEVDDSVIDGLDDLVPNLDELLNSAEDHMRDMADKAGVELGEVRITSDYQIFL